MKKANIFLLILLSLFIFTTVTVYGDNITKTIQVTYRNISILANGKQIQSEQEPFIYQGHTFIPLKTIGEALNKKVDWDNTKNQVIITDQVNPNPTVRMDSFYSLMNYLPDNYKIEKTEEKINENEFNIIKKFLEDNYSLPYDGLDKKMVFNFENIIQKNFHLISNNESITLFYLYYKRSDSLLLPILPCIKYENGLLYFITPQNFVCGSSDGWVSVINRSTYFESNKEYPDFYLSYLEKINKTIIYDKPNRTKQITLLYSIHINFRLINEQYN
jgi:hypothetical protein